MRLLDPSRADELVECYRAHNEPAHADLEAFAEIEPLLERLHGEGRRLGVVTAKRRRSVDLAFARCALEPWLHVVVTADDTERGKPHPDPILHALERLGSSAAEAAYVGDSPYDVQAAQAAGVHAIWVAWGGLHGRERLNGTVPDDVAETVEELYGLL
jgi:pyrophosphatase PpaX